MNSRLIFFLFNTLSAWLFLSSCSKTELTGNADQLDPAIDSTALLLVKWDYVMDSSTNVGNYYFVENGLWSPTPGVYIGVPGDFVHFKSDGTVDVNANGSSFTSTYALHSHNKLVITALQVHDTATVVLLNATHAVFDWSKTSPNGGRYFRRMYLQH